MANKPTEVEKKLAWEIGAKIASSDDDNIRDDSITEKVITPGELVAKRFFRNKLAIAGIGIIVLIALFSFAGPFFSPYGEYELFYKGSDGAEYSSNDFASGTVPSDVGINAKEPPSARHWLGTNQDGQDVLTRLMYGGRISLLIGFACVIIELFLGVLLGGIAGYYGKWVDSVIMRLVDIFYCLPTMPLVLILSGLLLKYRVPANMRIYVLMLVIGILGWAGAARMIRGQILSLREQEFMLATEALGLPVRRRIFNHLIPNVVPIIIVMGTLGVGNIILFESALSFLNLGVPLPLASWGNMVGAVRNTTIMINQPFIWLPAGLCILFTVLAFNFIGDGLRDAFDPKMKR